MVIGNRSEVAIVNPLRAHTPRAGPWRQSTTQPTPPRPPVRLERRGIVHEVVIILRNEVGEYADWVRALRSLALGPLATRDLASTGVRDALSAPAPTMRGWAARHRGVPANVCPIHGAGTGGAQDETPPIEMTFSARSRPACGGQRRSLPLSTTAQAVERVALRSHEDPAGARIPGWLPPATAPAPRNVTGRNAPSEGTAATRAPLPAIRALPVEALIGRPRGCPAGRSTLGRSRAAGRCSRTTAPRARAARSRAGRRPSRLRRPRS
jgi:hypothetical protein